MLKQHQVNVFVRTAVALIKSRPDLDEVTSSLISLEDQVRSWLLVETRISSAGSGFHCFHRAKLTILQNGTVLIGPCGEWATSTESALGQLLDAIARCPRLLDP